MDRETLWNDYTTLPAHARQEVADFIAFLRSRYSSTSAVAPPSASIAADPIIGLWADRVDMADSTSWVRTARTNDWDRDRG